MPSVHAAQGRTEASRSASFAKPPPPGGSRAMRCSIGRPAVRADPARYRTRERRGDQDVHPKICLAMFRGRPAGAAELHLPEQGIDGAECLFRAELLALAPVLRRALSQQLRSPREQRGGGTRRHRWTAAHLVGVRLGRAQLPDRLGLARGDVEIREIDLKCSNGDGQRCPDLGDVRLQLRDGRRGSNASAR